MASTTGARKRKRSASATAAAARFVPEDLVHKILLRLPSRSVLRFRAVCKAWLALFSDPNFVHEHHCLRPDLPLVSFRNACDMLDEVDCRVEALDLRTGNLWSVVRFTDIGQLLFSIYGSCDGLLLLNRDHTLYVCNPATHQLTCLGRRSYISSFVAFCRHDLTGEYRALLYRGDIGYSYFVAGSEWREIGWIPSEEGGYELGFPPSGVAALLHGNLHWPPERCDNHRIQVLDTAKEVFRWMRPPPVIREHMPVLQMEGKLAVFNCDEDVRVAELWLLQDYKNQMWTCKYRIELPALDIYNLYKEGGYIQDDWIRFFMSEEGRVAVVVPQQRLLVSDMNGYLRERFRWDGRHLKITPYTFKESLVRHALFETEDSVNYSEDESPPIFRRL